jgi:PAS domain S-box-containing protein
LRGKKSRGYQPATIESEPTDSSLTAPLSPSKVQEAPYELELRSRSILENTTAALFLLQELVVCYANPSACALSGYSEEELVGTPFLNLVHPNYRQEISQSFLANPLVESSPPSYQVIMLAKDGRERWLELGLNGFNYDDQPSCLITAFDITERHSAEKNLQVQVVEREKTVRVSSLACRICKQRRKSCASATILSTRPKIVSRKNASVIKTCSSLPRMVNLVTNAYGIFQEVNLAAARLLGMVQKYLIGKPMTVIIVRDEHCALFSLLEELRNHGGVQSGEFTVRSRNRQITPVDMAFSASPDPRGSGLNLRWILHDITYRKQAEEAIRQNTARAAILSDISQVIIEANLDEHAILDNIARTSAALLAASALSDYFLSCQAGCY